MAFSKTLIVVLLLVALVAVAAQSAPAKKIDCTSACHARCGRNWKNKMCNRMCNICCGKCNCVPPGTTQETRHLCPCYDKMVNTKNGKPKCP